MAACPELDTGGGGDFGVPAAGAGELSLAGGAGGDFGAVEGLIADCPPAEGGTGALGVVSGGAESDLPVAPTVSLFVDVDATPSAIRRSVVALARISFTWSGLFRRGEYAKSSAGRSFRAASINSIQMGSAAFAPSSLAPSER